MEIQKLQIQSLTEAPWNSNKMNEMMSESLESSITRFGSVQPLVVRHIGEGLYEIISGHQRLRALSARGHDEADCIVVSLPDSEAKPLSLAMNNNGGTDNLGLRAELVREVVEELGSAGVLAVLPETKSSLEALTSLGEEDMATYLQNWQAAQSARLKHFQAQLTDSQLQVVEEALAKFLGRVESTNGKSPNRRCNALFLLCQSYLEFSEAGY